ncbi:unnamed protein product [Cuscuta campestris]|uniref:Uncharacterized protein n=1 Tax=Cuscuta campestris TaxID=132261 RepID=A0A484LFF3_9ASTE|nr:unnamed protein product [Cuscuta campestris]
MPGKKKSPARLPALYREGEMISPEEFYRRIRSRYPFIPCPPPPPPPPPPAENSDGNFDEFDEWVRSKEMAVLSQDSAGPSTASSASPEFLSNPVVKGLLDCASVADLESESAEKLLGQLRSSVPQDGNSNERLWFYFLEALSSRISKIPARVPLALDCCWEEFSLSYRGFYQSCPYLKFGFLASNIAILEASKNSARIHIIDFGMFHGLQWEDLLPALAGRPAGKPENVRITCIPSALMGKSAARILQGTKRLLHDFARVFKMNLEFECVEMPIEELNGSNLRVDPDYFLGINFRLELFNLLDDITSDVPAAFKLSKLLKPDVVTLGEYPNRVGSGPTRFKNTLHFYSSILESLDRSLPTDAPGRLELERLMIRRRILVTVGFLEPPAQLEEKEPWMLLMKAAGFEA